MPRHPVSDLLLHNFPENGVKFLLHNPGNLRDVMAYLAAQYRTLPDLGCFDFSRRTIEPDTLIRSDFSHGVTDLLVRLPFRSGREPAAWIKMYLLVEHLSAYQRNIAKLRMGNWESEIETQFRDSLFTFRNRVARNGASAVPSCCCGSPK